MSEEIGHRVDTRRIVEHHLRQRRALAEGRSRLRQRLLPPLQRLRRRDPRRCRRLQHQRLPHLRLRRPQLHGDATPGDTRSANRPRRDQHRRGVPCGEAGPVRRASGDRRPAERREDRPAGDGRHSERRRLGETGGSRGKPHEIRRNRGVRGGSGHSRRFGHGLPVRPGVTSEHQSCILRQRLL